MDAGQDFRPWRRFLAIVRTPSSSIPKLNSANSPPNSHWIVCVFKPGNLWCFVLHRGEEYTSAVPLQRHHQRLPLQLPQPPPPPRLKLSTSPSLTPARQRETPKDFCCQLLPSVDRILSPRESWEARKPPLASFPGLRSSAMKVRSLKTILIGFLAKVRTNKIFVRQDFCFGGATRSLHIGGAVVKWSA